MTDPVRRALFARATELGFSRQERLELAEVVLRRDCATWQDLSDEEAGRLLGAFDGYTFIHHLIGLRP